MAGIPGARMKFDHVSIAVRSIDEAYAFFQRYFPIQLRNEKRQDNQVSGSFFWKDFWLGGFAIELIEDPPGQPGFVTKFIERHGEGLHHLSIEVDRLKPIVDFLKRDGVRVVDELTYPDGSATAFISPRSAFGALIQFWEVPNFEEHLAPPPRDGLAHFDHVSLAIKDMRATIQFFERYFGAKLTHQPHLSNSEGNFILANVDIGGFKLEFLQSPGPGHGYDFVGKFIDKYGEGMHHISIDLKDFDAVRDNLKAGGVRVVDEKRNRHGERQYFISPRSAHGVLIQFWDGV